MSDANAANCGIITLKRRTDQRDDPAQEKCALGTAGRGEWREREERKMKVEGGN